MNSKYENLKGKQGYYSGNGFIPVYEKRARPRGFFIEPSFIIFLIVVITIILIESGKLPGF